MSEKTIAMADNQTKLMDEHDPNRLRLLQTLIRTDKDEYEIMLEKKIGMGGESQVFLTKRVSDNQQVVIKIYDTYMDSPQNRRDRKAVLEFLKSNTEYKDKHIMPLWDDGKIEMFDPESGDYFDRPFDIIPFCVTAETADLHHDDKDCQYHSKIPNGEIKSADYIQLKNKIIPEILIALNLLHSNNLVHRDIKPNNIYMFDGVVLLADFGTTSQIINRESASKTQTRRGTPGFTAPEISDSYYVVASDYYSLGCSIATLYNNGRHIYQNLIDANDVESVNIAMRREGLPLECPENETDLQILVNALVLREEKMRAGFDAVNLWIKNTSMFIKLWKNPTLQGYEKSSLDFKFDENTLCKNIQELIEAVQNDWEKGKQYLYRGTFKGFFDQKNPLLANVAYEIVEDQYTVLNKDLGIAKFLHYLGTAEAPNCPIYWCNETYHKLSDFSIPIQIGESCLQPSKYFAKSSSLMEMEFEIDKKIISLLKSGFLSWKLVNIQPVNEEIIETLTDIQSITNEFDELGYFCLVYAVANDKPVVLPDEIFKELIKNVNNWQIKANNLLVNDLILANFISQGYKKAVIELKKNKTGRFISEEENSDLLMLCLFFESICTNKELVKEHYMNFGPQAKLYHSFINYPTQNADILKHEKIAKEYHNIKINQTLSIIDIFDKLKKFKIQRDIWGDVAKKIEKELRIKEEERLQEEKRKKREEEIFITKGAELRRKEDERKIKDEQEEKRKEEEEAKKRELELKKQETERQRVVWLSQGLCGYCGGEVVGWLNKKCKKCGIKESYKVGEFGPADGNIIYDKGNYSNGWRYLEVAPANTEFDAKWGGYGEDISGTETSIGSGKANTIQITEFLNRINVIDCATQRCVGLDINGYNDWFLPSKDELNLMYKYHKKKFFGAFQDTAYWSSSENGCNYAWYHDFKNNIQDFYYKANIRRVRAIRAF